MALVIGSTVWIFDGNRRVYEKGQRGPVYREHFIAMKIVGETTRSWIIDDNPARKVNKKTMETRGGYGIGTHVFASEQEVDDAVYVNDNKYQIAEGVRSCRNADTLRAIEKLLATT